MSWLFFTVLLRNDPDLHRQFFLMLSSSQCLVIRFRVIASRQRRLSYCTRHELFSSKLVLSSDGGRHQRYDLRFDFSSQLRWGVTLSDPYLSSPIQDALVRVGLQTPRSPGQPGTELSWRVWQPRSVVFCICYLSGDVCKCPVTIIVVRL